MNNLALMVDIGNSTLVFGFFRDGKLFYRYELPTRKESLKKLESTHKEIIEKLDLNIKDIKGGLLCSVAPSYTNHVRDSISKVFRFDIPVMDSSYFYDLNTIADDRNEIGHDIVADIYGAISEYGTNSIIIDLGTVTKVIPIEKDGLFPGVSFFPGVESSFSVISTQAEQISVIPNIVKPTVEYGNNTLDALSTGVYYAYLGAIKEFVSRAEKNLGNDVRKILTGGVAHLFASDLREYIIDKDLVLKGLYQLYIRN